MTNLLYKKLSYKIIGAAMEVHKVLGPGFLEQIYQTALERELNLRRIPFEAQKHIKVTYKGAVMGMHILDLLVDGKIIVELKAVSQLLPIHEAQLISYLKATGCQLGLLFNFSKRRLEYKRLIMTQKHGPKTLKPSASSALSA
ncbi:MAG: GxxExxY protein [Chloroflexota bacterium]|nr:GxxExxY protein [Chloroflexota bacterium]